MSHRSSLAKTAPTGPILLLMAVLAITTSPGCVRRRMTVRSNPPGAVVFVDDQEIGTTPVSTDFTYYGPRKIQLIKDGYETLTVKQNFFPPWYEIPPLDFISENLWPLELRNEHLVNFQLQPQQILPTDRLLERAEGLRTDSQLGYAVPLPNAPSTPQPISPLPPPALSVPGPPHGMPTTAGR